MLVSQILKLKNLLHLLLIFGFWNLATMTNAMVEENFIEKERINQAQQFSYVSGEILIKFKDHAIVGDVADQLVDKSGSYFQNITGDQLLDNINKKYNVRAFKRIFELDEKTKLERADISTGSGAKLTLQAAEKIHKDARIKHENKIKNIRAKKQASLERKGIFKDFDSKDVPVVPYLDNIYLVELGGRYDIQAVCQDYMKDPSIEFCQPNSKMEIMQNSPL